MGAAEMIVRVVSDRANDGRTIENSRRARHRLAEQDSRQLGLDGRVRPADFGRSCWFRIKCFELTWASAQPNLDYSRVNRRFAHRLRECLLTQNVGKRKASAACRQNGLQKASPRQRGGIGHERPSIAVRILHVKAHYLAANRAAVAGVVVSRLHGFIRHSQREIRAWCSSGTAAPRRWPCRCGHPASAHALQSVAPRRRCTAGRRGRFGE